MNSIERVLATVELRRPDRVPVDLHNFQPAAKALGMPLSQVFQDGDLLAEAMIKAWREFGHDMLLVENGTACNAQACGVKVVYREDAAPAAHVSRRIRIGPCRVAGDLWCLDRLDRLDIEQVRVATWD